MNVWKVKPLHTDKRGDIIALFDLINDPYIRSVLLITSKRGSVRANHYHKKDRHYTYLLSGAFEYSEQERDKPDSNEVRLIKPGEMVLTPTQKLHAMRFIKNSVMIVLTTEDRSPKVYEKDTVRVKLI